jgi:hypothetical protein
MPLGKKKKEKKQQKEEKHKAKQRKSPISIKERKKGSKNCTKVDNLHLKIHKYSHKTQHTRLLL